MFQDLSLVAFLVANFVQLQEPKRERNREGKREKTRARPKPSKRRKIKENKLSFQG